MTSLEGSGSRNVQHIGERRDPSVRARPDLHSLEEPTVGVFWMQLAATAAQKWIDVG